jgi:hypothetical protein
MSSTGIRSANAVYLVSCVSKKRKGPCEARDLYISEWFLKARAYVEATHSPWRILSAKYGLVAPDQVVGWYDETLNHMDRQARKEWAEWVIGQMKDSLPSVPSVVLFAGVRYREFLMDSLGARFQNVEVPMEGLGIGKQLQFLSHGLRHGNM